jgi:SagB-type dehydrogenase family enzyme
MAKRLPLTRVNDARTDASQSRNLDSAAGWPPWFTLAGAAATAVPRRRVVACAMPKLLWVALPLLVVVALLALQSLLRRQAPSRQALNIRSSLLLMAYVAATAGLGVFWVAHQQLPVFDWHYLFGYTTVLLVVVHLSFNLRIAWRWLARRQRARPESSAAADEEGAARERRRWIATVGGLLAAGAAFALGLRHGRSELHVTWPAPGGPAADAASGRPAAAASALALVERYHAFSSHTRTGVLLRAPAVDWGDPPPPFKRYPAAPRRALPPQDAGAVVSGTGFGLGALGAVLWHTAGVSDASGPVKLRTSPSAGALFSTELYVAARAVQGLPAGLWHYDAEGHALERLAMTVPDAAALGAPGDAAVREAQAVIVATALFRRTGHKYRDRSYRYLLADLGHALENMCVAAGALGATTDFVARFDESRAASALGIDEAEEGVLALVVVRVSAARAAAQPTDPSEGLAPTQTRPDTSGPRWRPPPPPDPQALALGVTGAMHLASSLRVATPQDAAARVAAPHAPPAALPLGALRLPRPETHRVDLLHLIATRRSVRRFASAPLGLEDLAGVLARTARAGDSPVSGAVRIHVVVNAVSGIAPGGYDYDAAAHALLPRRPDTDLRSTAQAAALDQAVIGGAAVVFVLSIDRAALSADPGGPARGYRHAFIEAGRVGERIYIEAGARGLGACAVGAFYDAEAAALVAIEPTRDWVVHFAALGVPAG